MYKFLIAVFFAGLQLFAIAQNKGGITITGKVVDSASKVPVEYATITLFVQGSNKVLGGTTTDSLGYFQITEVPPGTYNISVEFIGYKAYTMHDVIIGNKKPVTDLKTIGLYRSAGDLQGVVVTAKQKLIDNRIDKMVFNAEADLTSQGGVATDVLKKVPQVSVDPDGNVELAGTGGIRFLINGKPSSAFGSSVADVLQSIPASQIKSVEVITNPGAKYDAQGMGGIINIILKQTKVKGMNGNLSLTGGTRLQNGSLNLTVRNGNFGINAFVSGNMRLSSVTPSQSTRKSLDTASGQNVLFLQDGTRRFKRSGLESGVGFDWTVKKYNSFTGNVNYNLFANSGNGAVNQQQTTVAGNGSTLSNVLTLNNLGNRFSLHSVDASLGYKRTFASEDQSLEVGVNTSLGKNNLTSDNYQSVLPLDSVYYGINNHNTGTENETQITVDYAQPLRKDVMLGVGSKINFNDITSDANVFSLQPATKDYVYDPSVSNYLAYHQKVYALYAEVSLPVSNWFDAKVGTRYERTSIHSFYSNAQQQANNPGYNTLVPSVYFSRKLGDHQNVKISYSRRIGRPDYEDLNPFINTTDPKNVTAGNPYLVPEIGNRVELAYNLDFGPAGSFMATAYYRGSDHDIQPYTAFYSSLRIGDSTYTNVSVNTRENIGLEKNMGINLFGDLHPDQKWNIRANLFFFKRHIINGIDQGSNRTSYNYRTNINVSYQFSSTLVAEFFGNFNSARNELQGKYPSFTTYTMALRKQFWNKKGSLALTTNNLFSEYVNQATILYGTNFTTNSIRKIPFRSVGLNFTWKFGKLDFKKDKDEDKEIPAPEG